MSFDFWTGLLTSLALIVAVGSQNAYVLRQGIQREHVLALVLFCALSDALLIALGIAGAGALIQRKPALLSLTRYGGAIFLLTYGLMAAQRARRGDQMQVDASHRTPLGTALMTCFGFTFLNPHVYLDTVVLLGSVANQRGESARWVFGAGAMTASALWFCALGFGARLLRPLFQSPLAWRVLDGSIACTMVGMALLLLQSG